MSIDKEGEYDMVELRSFKLPEDDCDLPRLKETIPALREVNVCI